MLRSEGATADGVGETTDLDPAPLSCERRQGEAVRRFYRHYQPRLTRYARHRGADDPEGLADLAFLDGVRAAPNLDRPTEAAFRAYLYRALRSRMVSERRRKRLDSHDVAIGDPGRWRDGDPAPAVTDALLVDELLDNLTADQRTVIEDRFLLGYSTVETAARTGKSAGAVRKLQHDAIRKLRLVLAVVGALLLLATAAVIVSVRRGDEQRIIMETPVSEPTPTVEPRPDTDRAADNDIDNHVDNDVDNHVDNHVDSDVDDDDRTGSRSAGPIDEADPAADRGAPTSVPSGADDPTTDRPAITPSTASGALGGGGQGDDRGSSDDDDDRGDDDD